MKKTAFIVLLSACASLLCSCGYTMRSGVLQDIRRINIASFENETFEHGIEGDLSRQLAREFIVDGALSVASAEAADVRMSGVVTEYILEPYAYGEGEADVEQYLLRIRASVVLETMPDGELRWEEEAIEGETIYHLEGRFAKTENEARAEALRDLARRIVRRTVGAW